MTLTITGRGTRQGELPVSEAEALAYFRDLRGFISKINEVDTIVDGPQNSLLVSHAPIGGMNYFVTVVYALTGTWHDHGVRFGAADFDIKAMKSAHQLVRGIVTGHLTTKAVDEKRTAIDLDFQLAVDLPVPFALKFVPEMVLKTTADGIMNLKVAASVESMYRKAEQDFGLR